MIASNLEHDLCRQLGNLPREFNNRYSKAASHRLLQLLFQSLSGNRPEYARLLFPAGPPSSPEEPWSLRTAQGAIEGAEYTEAARGQPCGHIFKSGEATYRCKTCAVDDTCVLCSKCYDASDHEDHLVYVSISPGNSGCCDCGDAEAWVRPMHCNIHSLFSGTASEAMGKAPQDSPTPKDLASNIKVTIARALDYLCDVYSCSPEQLRLQKTAQTIAEDEQMSRLSPKGYGDCDNPSEDEPIEYCLVLWNDEKHTVTGVQDQVARACKKRKEFGLATAHEVDDVGRSVVEFSTDVAALLKMAKIIEEIKLTVTIRSARDTFREQMCGTIVEWIHDIAGCSVGSDNHILRDTICEEMLRPWRQGSQAHHVEIGKDGIDDHQADEEDEEQAFYARYLLISRRRNGNPHVAATAATTRDDGSQDGESEDGDGDDEQDEDYREESESAEGGGDDEMDVDPSPDGSSGGLEGEMDVEVSDGSQDALEAAEATFAGYPPPPPPPPPAPAAPELRRQSIGRPADHGGPPENLSSQGLLSESILNIPKTPKIRARSARPPRPPKYWLDKPEGFTKKGSVPIHEDLLQRVRLDFMILYDLRMWKKVRIDLRDVYISTVVTIPYFKRLLGLRFAGLYTALAQLYLIADREPDHSIINLSLQMLTTPSITAEVVERGNFLTNLMAILHTFLTTRQVGFPADVNPLATLAFDAGAGTGAVTNRRMYHFFLDLKYLIASDQIQQRLCREERYLMQFLDLVKLHQGICPNVRAIGEHIEYETDTWIGASIITREVNRLCRQFSEAFSWERDQSDICRAIQQAAKVVIINSLGVERKRFDQSEIKGEIRFRILEPFEFEVDRSKFLNPRHEVVDFVVEKEPMSFHHALHYTLSWLLDRGKSMTRDQARALLQFTAQDLKEVPIASKSLIPDFASQKYLLAAFDFPLRVCAWLSQMRATMWVRNGITLRHQMGQYRGVAQRDVSYHRDIFLLQSAFVLCDPATFLATMVARFGLDDWVRGNYEIRTGFEELQMVEVAEDFIHHLIILLCDRVPLLPSEDETKPQLLSMRKDIVHILCFKPLSHSELSMRIPERISDADDFGQVLADMTKFRPPEGLSDTGTFELKQQYLEDLDPFVAHYHRNQREEAENIYRSFVSKKTGKDPEQVVFEPKLLPIKSGIFKDLAGFTKLPLFAQIIFYFLEFVITAQDGITFPELKSSKIESFLHFLLHLVLIAVLEDDAPPQSPDTELEPSFILAALLRHSHQPKEQKTILATLVAISKLEDLKACRPKIRLIHSRIQQKQPKAYAFAMNELSESPDVDMESANTANELDREEKKKQARARQARVMAQFKEQQNNFISNQSIDWGEDLSDLEDEDMDIVPTEEKLWKFPSGRCILCQEETNDQRLYGTFAYMTGSRILRQTDLRDVDWVRDAAMNPASLDRSAENLRPYGVASQNRRTVEKVAADGRVIVTERQDLGKGFPRSHTQSGPVTTGCGHIMHYSCFEVYLSATSRRHINQIVRNHPERIDNKEFLCPLCKALGNTFLPVIWKEKAITYPGVLSPASSFDDWLTTRLAVQLSKLSKGPERSISEPPASQARQQHLLMEYGERQLIQSLVDQLPRLIRPSQPAVHTRLSQRLSLPAFLESSNTDDIRDGGVLSPQAGPSADLPPPMNELFKIYQRLRDTMRVNDLGISSDWPTNPGPTDENLTMSDTLIKSLGFSISAVEISRRGLESEVGTTLIDQIPQQSLTHLRVLSESITSYIAMGCLRNQGLNKAGQQFHDLQTMQLSQLFGGHSEIAEPSLFTDETKFPSLLAQDMFIFLADCSSCLAPALRLDIHHVLRLCYLAEVVKVILAFSLNGDSPVSWLEFIETERNRGCTRGYGDPKRVRTRPQMRVFVDFAQLVLHGHQDAKLKSSRAREEAQLADEQLEVYYYLLFNLIEKYLLPFMRKAAILMHVRYGIEFPHAGLSNAGEPELQRLTTALRLPSIDELCANFLSERPETNITRSLVNHWIHHHYWSTEGSISNTQGFSEATQHSDFHNLMSSLGTNLTKVKGDGNDNDPATRNNIGLVRLSHPSIFELVGLPKNYDALTDEAIRRKCPTTGKELTDPCVCLFCGDIFCSQGVCCMSVDRKGGCIQHQKKCGGNIGLFINIRKCMVLFLNDENGSWVTAPYLDKHGETDPTLRRHHQLFLNQKRYDALLRNVWLQHGVPSLIARRLEGDNNNGGWDTM